jgi:hypothetical protein
MKTDELTITGLVFSGIVLAGMYLTSQYKINQQINELQTNYTQAMTIAVELDEENTSMHDSLLGINEYVDELEAIVHDPELVKLIQIRRDLRSYSIEERAIGYSVSWTESGFRLDPNHGDNGFTKGPCGITEYHVDYLHELGLTRYSYASCVEIYKLYKEKYGSRYAAIKAYKGIKTRTDLIDKTLTLRDKILKILKEK